MYLWKLAPFPFPSPPSPPILAVLRQGRLVHPPGGHPLLRLQIPSAPSPPLALPRPRLSKPILHPPPARHGRQLDHLCGPGGSARTRSDHDARRAPHRDLLRAHAVRTRAPPGVRVLPDLRCGRAVAEDPGHHGAGTGDGRQHIQHGRMLRLLGDKLCEHEPRASGAVFDEATSAVPCERRVDGADILCKASVDHREEVQDSRLYLDILHGGRVGPPSSCGHPGLRSKNLSGRPSILLPCFGTERRSDGNRRPPHDHPRLLATQESDGDQTHGLDDQCLDYVCCKYRPANERLQYFVPCLRLRLPSKLHVCCGRPGFQPSIRELASGCAKFAQDRLGHRLELQHRRRPVRDRRHPHAPASTGA